ncbi:MAG: replicative DNA helicase [Puniceicoccales bacterium]|jgi:replicative DNA helicase|nr:replicative DNA helicase [Puniceicoccales bacterium]
MLVVKANESINRTPPFSAECEQALLAGCIIDGGQNSITSCIQEKITPDSFYLPAHSLIYNALLELYSANVATNELIVAEKLAARGELEKVGGHEYINTIANRIDTPAHLKYYIERVKDLDLIRKIIAVATISIENAYAGVDDVRQFLDNVEKSILAISGNRVSDTIFHIKKLIDGAANLINHMDKHRGEVTGVASGFIDLDRLTSGFHPGEMIVVAARPSMGKTSFALNIAENATISKASSVPTLFFSLEMSAEQLAMRMLCSRSGVDMTKLRNGFVPKAELTNVSTTASALKTIPLWIDESTGMSVTEMRAKARRMCNKHKLGLIIIDYLQLLVSRDPKVPREQQISEISRGIKDMARELSLPVIVLSQLNREAEKEKRQPRLSDLRESGAIEQDADIVLMLAKQKDSDDNQEVLLDIVPRDLIIAKQRNGPVGVVRLAFRKSLTRFENYAKDNNS